MDRLERERVQEILHAYKKECYRIQHVPEEQAQVTREIKRSVEEVLSQQFHFHFHKPPDSQRVEALGMIENYTREAVLPPVLGKLLQRIIVLERRHEAGVKCLEQLIDLLDEK